MGNRWGSDTDPGNATVGDWRAAALADFARWLEGLDEQEAAGAPEAQRCDVDLHALFSEMAALRQEVRLQTREQARSVRHGEDGREALAAALEQIDEQVQGLRGEREASQRERAATRAGLEEVALQARWGGVCDVLVPLLEVRDALERGRTAAALVTARRRWLRPAGLEEVTAGYDMALARFDRTLAHLGVRLVGQVGSGFDPQTMVAAAARRDAGTAEGTVVEVLRTGFATEDGQVLRPAEVVVSRNGASG